MAHMHSWTVTDAVRCAARLPQPRAGVTSASLFVRRACPVPRRTFCPSVQLFAPISATCSRICGSYPLQQGLVCRTASQKQVSGVRGVSVDSIFCGNTLLGQSAVLPAGELWALGTSVLCTSEPVGPAPRLVKIALPKDQQVIAGGVCVDLCNTAASQVLCRVRRILAASATGHRDCDIGRIICNTSRHAWVAFAGQVRFVSGGGEGVD